MLNLKVSKQARSEANKDKVIIKRVSNISINLVNQVLEYYKKAHYKKIT